jgi:hypothetical protein
MSLAHDYCIDAWTENSERRDLTAFLADAHLDHPIVPAAANDNFAAIETRYGMDGEILSSVWSPRFRTAD